jgi:hypothetical protein
MKARYSNAIAVISTIMFLINEIIINFSTKIENHEWNDRMVSVKLKNESNKCEKARPKAK